LPILSKPSENEGSREGEICSALGLRAQSAKLANCVYFLRNNFGAHAGGWRWWDQDELFDDELTLAISRLAANVLMTAANLEPQICRIDPDPKSWDDWA
jgi:hypothetical protein